MIDEGLATPGHSNRLSKAKRILLEAKGLQWHHLHVPPQLWKVLRYHSEGNIG